MTVHGDAWVNNTMFTYDDSGKPSKVLLLDLQLVGEACPTVDFARIFYTSLKPDIRQKYTDHFLQIYHDKFLYFCYILKSEPLPGFNMETLRRRYRRLQIDGFILTLSLLNLSLSPPPPAPDSLEFKERKTKSIIEIFKGITEANKNNRNLIERLCETAREVYENGVI